MLSNQSNSRFRWAIGMGGLVFLGITFLFYQIFVQSSKVQNHARELSSVSEYYQKEVNLNGITIQAAQEVSDEAMQVVENFILKMTKERPETFDKLKALNARISIFSNQSNLCELPEFDFLKTLKTFDGRDYCGICGVGATTSVPVTAICEDNLLKNEKDPYRGKENIFVHEFAHTLHSLVFSETEKEKITKLYQFAVEKSIFTENSKGEKPYMMENEEEFFATFSAAWFDSHNPNSSSVGKGLLDKQSIQSHFPEMFTFLQSIYGE